MVTHDIQESLQIFDYIYLSSCRTERGRPGYARRKSALRNTPLFHHSFSAAGGTGTVPFHIRQEPLRSRTAGARRVFTSLGITVGFGGSRESPSVDTASTDALQATRLRCRAFCPALPATPAIIPLLPPDHPCTLLSGFQSLLISWVFGAVIIVMVLACRATRPCNAPVFGRVARGPLWRCLLGPNLAPVVPPCFSLRAPGSSDHRQIGPDEGHRAADRDGT